MITSIQFRIFISAVCMSVCADGESWPIGLIEMIDVDATLVSDAAGSDVIDAALDKLDTSCIFLNDRMLLRRYATAISNDGLGSYKNAGGVWQASEEMLVATRRIAELTPMGAAILNQFGIDWLTVTSSDLLKPFYSALTFRFYLQTLPSCSLPRTHTNQAAFLIEEIPTAVPVNASLFVNNLVTSDETACSLAADIVFILDGSVDLSSLKTFVQNFTSQITLVAGKTKVAVVQFTDTTNVEFSLKEYSNAEQLRDAIEFIQPLGLTDNSTVDIPAALTIAANLFTSEIETTTENNEASRIAILVTHSQTNSKLDLMSARDALQQLGVAVFAIGIGGGVDSTDLQTIGSDCSHVAHLSDITELEKIVPEIKMLVCKQPVVPEFGSPMRRTIYPGEKMYTKFNVKTKEGFKIDLNVMFGEVLVYMSTKLKRPSSAVHHWKCKADMNQRGSCYIPPAQFSSLVSSSSSSQVVVVLYATYTTNAQERTTFYTTISGEETVKLSPLLYIILFCAIRMVDSHR